MTMTFLYLISVQIDTILCKKKYSLSWLKNTLIFFLIFLLKVWLPLSLKNLKHTEGLKSNFFFKTDPPEGRILIKNKIKKISIT